MIEIDDTSSRKMSLFLAVYPRTVLASWLVFVPVGLLDTSLPSFITPRRLR